MVTLKMEIRALAGQLCWLECQPDTLRLQVRSLVRAHQEATNECISE